MCLGRMRSIVLAGIAGLIACASPAKPAHPAVIALGDAMVAAPPRWHVEQRADRVTFTDPDRALHVTIGGDVHGVGVTSLERAESDRPGAMTLTPSLGATASTYVRLRRSDRQLTCGAA